MRKVLASITSLLTLAACAEPYVDYEPEPPKPPGAAPEVDLQATISKAGDELAVSYTLTNNHSGPVVAYVGVMGDAASHSWDVYITARKDGTVEIAKRTFTIPPGVNADSPGEIKGKVLATQEKFQESFRVRLPLEPRRPYKKPGKLPDPVTKVVFCVGVMPQQEAPAPRGDVYPLNGPQHLICSPAVDL